MSQSPTVISALDRYTNATRAVQRHIEDNAELFKAHDLLVGNQIDARAALEDAAVEEFLKLGVEEDLTSNGVHRVGVKSRNEKVVNPEDLKQINGRVLTSELIDWLIKEKKRSPAVVVTTAPQPR